MRKAAKLTTVAEMLLPLNGRRFSSVDKLRTALRDIVWKYRAKLPTDFETRDLAEAIQKNNWFKREGKVIYIDLSPKQQAEKEEGK
ncbi:MAG: hypothetical protein AAB389_01195 [Patescibacteria group bacterium]|mgnify:CR=1 FL=1